MTPRNLRARAARLRLPVRDLAARAGLDEDNVHRVLKGRTDPRLSTLQALDRVLAEEEARLLADLSPSGATPPAPDLPGRPAPRGRPGHPSEAAE